MSSYLSTTYCALVRKRKKSCHIVISYMYIYVRSLHLSLLMYVFIICIYSNATSKWFRNWWNVQIYLFHQFWYFRNPDFDVKTQLVKYLRIETKIYNDFIYFVLHTYVFDKFVPNFYQLFMTCACNNVKYLLLLL